MIDFESVMRDSVDVADDLFHRGLPLIKTVDRRLALDLELFSRGGMRVLDKIRAQNYDVLKSRPAISKWERLGFCFGACRGWFTEPNGVTTPGIVKRLYAIQLP